MKIFKLTIVILLLLLTFASVSYSATNRELVLKDGEKLTINKVYYKAGVTMPPSGSLSISAIQRIWNKLSTAAKFDAFVMYDPKEEVNAYITQANKNDFLVVIQLGLLKVLKTEDEVAGVIGHEIGHGVKRHGEKRQGNTAGVVVGANILSSILGGGLLGDLAVGIGANLAVSGYSREHEVEADDFGVEYSTKAGYSPWGLYNSINSMSKAGLVTPPSGFNSHPPTERRMTRLKNEAQKWEKYVTENSKTQTKEDSIKQTEQVVHDGNLAINKSDGVDVIDSYPIDQGQKNVLTVLHNRATTLYNSGKYKEALSAFIRGVNTYKKNYLSALWAARCAQKLGDKKEMKKWVDKSLEINPSYVPAKQFKDMYF